MNWLVFCLGSRWRYAGGVALLALAGLVAAPNWAAAADGGATAGRIDFDAADLPTANVEVDVGRGMFSDLFGLGDAAIAGAAQTLLDAAKSHPEADDIHATAEQLAAGREIVRLSTEVIDELRVRVYESMPEGVGGVFQVAARFDDQLQAGDWDHAVQVRDGDDTVRIALLRDRGAIRAAFVIVCDGQSLVLVNFVGDISPEHVRALAAAATKIGLDNGLLPSIKFKLKLDQAHGGEPPAPPHPPANGETGS